jgi:electron transport complex protein RnfC
MKLKTFSGGVHPNDNKKYSQFAEAKHMPIPDKVVIFLSQHIGSFSKPIVAVGDMVKKGQLVAEPGSFVSINMHASISGKVSKIEKFPHPSGALVTGIEIESDGKDEWVQLFSDEVYDTLTGEEMLQRIKDAGICGMGGAGFPTHVKLTPPVDRPIDTVIVNAVECEPYLTADCRVVIERAEDVIRGLRIAMKIVGATNGIIGIENNKPIGIKLMRELSKGIHNIRTDALKLKYPQGAEKQLIYATTKRKVPNRGGLPSSVGCVVINVATILNIYDAVRYRRPLIERVTTVTGKIVNNPSNIITRVGTKFSDIVSFCGGTKIPFAKVISGGPMMGFALNTLDTYSTKTSSGVVLLSEHEAKRLTEKTCIRCGRCVDVCPQKLMPCMIAASVKYDDLAGAEKAGTLDCVKCGCCSYVCPSHIKKIQWIELGRLKILELKEKKKNVS